MRNWGNIKKIVGISIISISLIETTIPAIANNFSDLEQQKQLELEMKKRQEQINKVKRKENDIFSELKEITNDVSKLNNDINNLE